MEGKGNLMNDNGALFIGNIRTIEGKILVAIHMVLCSILLILSFLSLNVNYYFELNSDHDHG